MGVIRKIADWLGLSDDNREDVNDPLVSALAPYEHDHTQHRPLDTIFTELRERDGCPHWSATAVEVETTIFHCRDCGLTYRHKVDPAKPWLIVGYEPVQVSL